MPAGDAIGDGRKVVAASATAERLINTRTVCSQVIITAETDNTGIISVGGSTVIGALATRRGTPLAASESVTFHFKNLRDIWLDTTVDGDGVTFTYITE